MGKAGRKRGGGRSARIAARQSKVNEITTSIERRIPYFDVLNEEALGLIEHNAETVLEDSARKVEQSTKIMEFGIKRRPVLSRYHFKML